MKEYPKLNPESPKDISILCRDIMKQRKNDVNDFINLNNVFISGRKVGKIPTGSADVDPSDIVGDFNYDISYIYILVNNAGTATWRRASVSSW